MIGVAFAIITQDYIHAGQFIAALLSSAAGGFLSAVVSTGSLKQGVFGAFQAGITFGIGGSGWGAFGKIAANAVAGGVFSVLEGGRFGNGFVAAGLTTAAMPLAGNSQYAVVRSVEGALIGGTISDLTGGKFADGAISGAIQGAMTEPQSQNSSGTDNSDSGPTSAGASYSGKTANVVSGTAGSFRYRMWAGVDSSGRYGSGILLDYDGDATNLKWLQTCQAYSPAAGEDGTWQFDHYDNAKTKFYPAVWAPGRQFQDFPASSTTRSFQAETSIVSRNPAGTYSIIGTVKWGYTYTAGAGLNGVIYSTPVVIAPSALQQGYIKSLNGGH